jgi:DNA invertase Pin-like site-specific DNA recombinase
MSPETIPRRSWTAIYTRQSRSSPGDFSSCEAQLSACLNFVMARLGDGWVWNGKRYDDEGQSGDTLDRPGLQRLLADIRAGEIGRVVVHRLDRLSRRIVDCAALLQEFKDRQVPLTIVAQPDLSVGAQQTLMLNLMALFAEFEQEMTRERLAETRAAMKRHGLRVAGIVPYGYTADPVSKQLQPDPREARRVQAMFRMASEGKTPREIAATVTRRGWRTKERVSKTGNRTGGGRWTPRQILATLCNPVYVGLIRDGERTRPGSHKAIVTVDLFQQVAAAIASRRSRAPGRQKPRTSWPLRGLLKCGQCGRPMSPSRSGHKNFIYRYYRCRSYAGGRPPCRSVCVPAFEIEKYVLNALGDPALGRTEANDALDADHQRQIVANHWAMLDDRARQELLRLLVREVVFHKRRGTISITLDPEAVGRLCQEAAPGESSRAQRRT